MMRTKEQRERYNENRKEHRRADPEENKEQRKRRRKRREKKLGHKIKGGEIIHHIDMNKSNNDPENLYVYINHSEHIKGHRSLNELVFELLEKDIIGFVDGRYRM